MTAVATPLMTMEELLALPDDGMERWLVRGKLRERPMTYRNRTHSRVVARVTTVVDTWLSQQPEPRGWVGSGDAGCRLTRNPDTVFGVDVLYISPAIVAQQTNATTLIEGVPTLAVEVLSPSDQQEDIDEKTDAYLDAGTSLVWIINCRHRIVTVLRPGAKVEAFDIDEELSAEPHLPGFRVKVRDLFNGVI